VVERQQVWVVGWQHMMRGGKAAMMGGGMAAYGEQWKGSKDM